MSMVVELGQRQARAKREKSAESYGSWSLDMEELACGKR